MSEWQPIETAPRDGTWFIICQAGEGPETYEIGIYDPIYWDTYIPTGNGLFRKERKLYYEWRRFNNFHRATHWMPINPPETPA